MRPVFLFAAVALVATAIACGGGGSDSTATPTTTDSPTPRTVTPTPEGAKTTSPDQPSPSVAATAPGETPTAPPVAAVGTPAAAPEDQEAFATSFAGQQVDLVDCVYNPTTAVVNCQSVLYAIDPPMVGQDITCMLWMVSGTPRAVACAAAEPPGTTYYEIEG
jgi:hypothetical protein